MRHIKKKCGCNLWEYDLNEILTGKAKPKNSVYCLKHKKEIATRAGLKCKHCGERYDTCLCTRKGKGWREPPDASGKAPDHRDARLRAQAKGACNISMARTAPEKQHTHAGFLRQAKKPYIVTGHESISKISNIGCAQQFSRQRAFSDIFTDWLGYHGITLTEQQFDLVEELVDNWFKGHGKGSREKKDTLAERIVKELKIELRLSTTVPKHTAWYNTNELYHVTFKSKSSKLLKEGIQPKKPSTYTGMFGRKLKDPGTIYAFSNFDDAVRWASKMQFDFKKPTIIIAFRGNISEWEQDTHWQSAGAKGRWLKKKGAISPEDIIELIGVSQRMTQAVVQTGGTSKELTRMHGVMEME